MKDNLVFTLDIGTRSVIGIAGRQNGELFEVLAAKCAQHPKRAMIDGQIEDIGQVAKIAGTVKQAVEQDIGQELHTVSVAAAGRALKTCPASFTIALNPAMPIGQQQVYELESGAINCAREELEKLPDAQPNYCVGHSVVRYYVDDYPFATIVGHRGTTARADIIATFLPTEVVNSLRSCMDMLGLDIDTLTLEPIAAMRAVIPPDVRLLNLALVDIGAGTSDIAITEAGTVAGYTMATVAGDEITEAIIRSYLVDFATAESIKYSLEGQPSPENSNVKDINFTDILGFEHSIPAQDIFRGIEDAIDNLAAVIGDKIAECNGKPPAAVFLVGGGSNTPGLAAKLAAYLGLPENKVARAGTNFSARLVNKGSGIDSPEYATPLGIALTAADNNENQSGTVCINGKRVRLYSARVTNVMDALMIGGWRYQDLMGRSGRSLSFTLNGEKKVLRGGMYSTAEVSVNGRPATLTAPVKSGDSIEIVPAKSGRDAAATAESLVEGYRLITVSLNGKSYKAGRFALINGHPAPPAQPIKDFDEVSLCTLDTVADLLSAAGAKPGQAGVTVNRTAAQPGQLLQEGDDVELSSVPATGQQEDDAVKTQAPLRQILTAPSPEAGTAPQEAQAEESRAATGGTLRISLNGKAIALPPKNSPHLLYDLIALVDIDPEQPGGLLFTRINGKNAAYTAQLSSGDTVEIGREGGPEPA